MITKTELEIPQGLTKKAPQAFKLGSGEKIILYAQWFVLELPKELLDASFDWEEPNEEAQAWRTRVPEGTGEYAQAVRWKNPKDEVVIMKLISDNGVALIQAAFYDVVRRVPDVEFRVFPGEKTPVVVVRSSTGEMIGVTAQVAV